MMKSKVFSCVAAAVVALVMSARAADAVLPVIPQPASWVPSGGLVAPEAVRTTFALAADAELGEEGYEIRIASDGVKVTAPTERGLGWARQTLAQLAAGGGRLPTGVIRDRPKYRSRGFMLDVARTFVDMKFLRALVRDMAYYKFNLLHLHLNDDGPSYFLKDGYHAFRLECETYPDLTAKDGHYTKAEFRALVKEASELGVTILPEFDTPWHAGCFKGVKALRDRGVDGLDLTRMDVVCPFIEKLWAEYLDGPDPVFPGKYVHVGTDEYPFDAELFRRYSDWIFGMVRRHGREPQAWGALTHKPGKTNVRADRNIVMDIWCSPFFKPEEALAAGYSVVSVPESLLYIVPAAGYYRDYLDLPYLHANWEPANIGGTYHPYDMKPDDARLVGGKFALWNDICGNGISDDDMFDRIFPALQVLGEKMWRGKTDEPWEKFAARAAKTFEAPGVNVADRLTGPGGTVGTNDVAVGWTQGGYEVSFVLLPHKGKRGETVLFDDGTSQVKLLGETAGDRIAFSRDGYTHVFDARFLPWERKRFAFRGDARGVTLFVDGELAGSTAGLLHRYEKREKGKPEEAYMRIVRTLHFPLRCVAPAGRVADLQVRIGTGVQTPDGATSSICVSRGRADICATGIVRLVDWEFSRNGTDWQKVSVPHDWAIAGPFDREIDRQVVAIVQDGEKKAAEKTGRTGALPWIGKGEYRRRITLPEGVGWAALVFDGAMSEPRVFCDGRQVGEWKHGYNAFEVELPPIAGEHEIRVTLNNRPQSSRWYPGAGLFRPVELRYGGRNGLRTWGVSVCTPDLKTVSVAAECRGEIGRLAYSIRDGAKTVARAEDPRPSENRRTLIHGEFVPWSPEEPHLYTLVTEAYAKDGTLADRHEQRFGVRTLEYGQGFFALNGRHRKFRGVCLHHDLGPLGAAFDADAYRRQVTLLKEMGCDSIRTSHNMPGEGQLAVCDELGMMVMAESFDSWSSPKVANGYNLFFDAWWRRDIENLVRKCRNHPSVVMWSIGNEIDEQTNSTVGVAFAKALQEECHRFDPDPARKVTQGLSWMPQAIESGVNGVMEIPGVTYRLPFYEAMYKATKTGIVLGAETASTVSSRGEYFFPVEAGKDVQHGNGQCSGYDIECCPWSNLPDDDWAMQEDRPWTIGEFVWTGFDYLGEPTPYNTYWPSRSSYFGIFDLAGLPKDRYWLYRSRWNASSHTLHLVPHWTFPGREGEVTPVYCYTDFDEAELFVNGKSQGRRRKDPSSRLDRYRLRWNDVVYEPGELKVVAYGKGGGPAMTECVRTAGEPVRVDLTKRRFGRLLFVTATLVDAAGTPVPNADRALSFSCGRGLRFRAICNGDATSVESFVEPHMRTFHGQLVAIFEGEGEKVGCGM